MICLPWARRLWPEKATSVVMDKYRIVSARNLGLVAYGVIWLAGIIGLHSYYVNSKSVRQLFYRFGAVALGEVAVWGARLRRADADHALGAARPVC